MTAFNIVNPITTCIRQIFMILDICVYYFLQFNFELFFNIVAFDPIDREVLFKIISSVQLIIGVFMMFQLVMIILKGIVNPDTITDSKSGGASNVIMRILVSLVLLALVVPINISNPRNEYERQINNNGILFGTLYSLQYRILSNNTIGRIITQPYLSKYTNREEKKSDKIDAHDFANRFTGTMIRVFYPLSVDEDGNYLCQDGWDEEYYNEDRAPLWIIAQGARKCGADSGWDMYWDNTVVGSGIDTFFGKRYAISMSYLTCTVVGLVMVVLVFMMVFGVAKRVFQLVALQVIAPIPIISYMDPKGSKDGAFNSWLKLLGKTYLDLFVRIAVMYFAIVIIQSFMDKYFGSVENIWGTISSTVDNAYTVWYSFMNFFPMIFWEFIVITIGLFLFALEAPKFFKQILGIKDDGKGFFSDFGTAMGLGIAGAGVIGSFASGARANYDADATNAKIAQRNRLYNLWRRRGLTEDEAARRADIWANKYGETYASKVAHGSGNRAKNVLAGLLSAGRGVVQGSAAASESKGNAWAKVMAARDAMHAGDLKTRAAGRNGSTAISGVTSLIGETFTGQNAYDALDVELKNEEQKLKNRELDLKPAQDALKRRKDINGYRDNIIGEVKAKVKDSKVTKGTVEYSYKENGVTRTIKLEDENYYELHSAIEAAKSQGDGVTTIETGPDAGKRIWKYKGKDIDFRLLDIIDNEALKANENDFYDLVVNKRTDPSSGKLLIDNNKIIGNIERYYKETGKNIEATFGDLKKEKGNEDLSMDTESQRIAKELQDISDKRAKLNQRRQSDEGQQALYDSQWGGRKGGGSS